MTALKRLEALSRALAEVMAETDPVGSVPTPVSPATSPAEAGQSAATGASAAAGARAAEPPAPPDAAALPDATALPEAAPLPEAVAPPEAVRIAEALLFAAAEPMSEGELAGRLPAGANVPALLEHLSRTYAGRGVNLVRVSGRWAFRTAGDLSFLLARDVPVPQKPTRAAMEVLAIVAYHQPATRAEIEEIRGVSTSKGTLDTLIEAGWVRLRGRRKAPGRPITFGTTPAFLDHFGLDALSDLPGVEELKGLGFLQGRAPPGLEIPIPSDAAELRDDEEPLDLLSGLDADEEPLDEAG